MENSNLEKRIERLEGRVSELYNMVKTFKETFDEFTRARNPVVSMEPAGRTRGMTYEVGRAPRLGSVLGMDRKGPNPWALEAAMSFLLDDRIGRNIIKSSYETYKPTIEALKSESEGLSATEVSKKTKRKRNTESGYLNRLLDAGIVEVTRKGRKTLFRLRENTLSQVFGQS